VFEVLWKSGDKTWLPFDSVEHLDTLKDYFNVVGIDSISELTTGNGDAPVDDPQVFSGHVFISDEYFNDANSQNPQDNPPLAPSSSIFHKPTLSLCLFIMAPLFQRINDKRFTLVNGGISGGDIILITADQARAYLEYDAHQ
jgi:hypothetical protein